MARRWTRWALLLGWVAAAGMADAALSRLARAERLAERLRAEARVDVAARAVEATLARWEGGLLAGSSGAGSWRQAVPERAAPIGVATERLGERSDEELRELLGSARATASGLPVAVLAALVLDEPRSTALVRDRLLRGRVPVLPRDLEGLVRLLDVPDGPELDELRGRLSALPERIPSFPEFERRLGAPSGDGQGARIEAWSRFEGEVFHYALPIADLLERAGVGGDVEPEIGPGAVDDATGGVVADVPGLRLRAAAVGAQAGSGAAVRLAVAATFLVVLVAGARVLRAADRERAAADRERTLLASVSHDLRTPLASFRLFGESLAEGTGDSREYGRMIADRAEGLEERLESVLAAARAGEVLRLGPVDPAAVLAGALERTAGLARAHDVEWRVEEPSPLPEASWDAEAVEAALANLLDNAIRHGGAGRPVVVRVRPEGRKLRYTVRDHGSGVPEADRRRIFERFARSESAGPGSGLGLWLAERTARAHGGRLELECPRDGGCRFHLILPLQAPRAEGSPAEEEPR